MYEKALEFRKGLTTREKIENWAETHVISPEARLELFSMIEDYASTTRQTVPVENSVQETTVPENAVP